MRLRSVLAGFAVLVSGIGLAGAEPVPAGCAAGSVEAAAVTLFGRGTEVASRGTVAGFDSAVAMTFEIYPGVRHRLIAAGGSWCDAASGFNNAWRANGRSSSSVDMASAFASLAAATNFDEVTVRSAREIAPNTVFVTTHALTNGVVAEWTITVDADGVKAAKWIAREFAVEPFRAQIEGPTAVPGASGTFVREGRGLLRGDDHLLSRIGEEPATTQLTAVGNDGFEMRIRRFHSRVGVSLGFDTADEVDFLRFVRRVTLENYNEFLTWGLEQGWSSPTGAVLVDDSTSLLCLACVFIAQDFNIHISSQVVLFLEALGFHWDDDKLAFSNVIGHEMFHNFQNAYYKPENNVFTGTGISEGQARFQETLHGYSHVNHQPGSLVYTRDGIDSCNDYAPNWGANLLEGPQNRSYSACAYWMTYYARHGVAGIEPMLAAAFDHKAKNGWAEFRDIVQQASGSTVAAELSDFARMILTGRGFTWGPATADGPALDWAAYLNRWSPEPLSGASTYIIGQGRLVGAPVTGTSIVNLEAVPSALLYKVVDNGTNSSVTQIARGSTVTTTAGSQTWVVVVGSGSEYNDATLELVAV